MARFELKLPKMGESVAEATITSWLKEVGDTIELDEAIVEIATDKVDSEVPSEVEGTLVEVLFEKDEVVAVGATIAIIETDGEGGSDAPAPAATNMAVVEILKVFAPSPPVPTISTKWLLSATDTLVANSRITMAAAVISPIVSFLVRKPVKMAAVSIGDNSPDMIERMMCIMSSCLIS